MEVKRFHTYSIDKKIQILYEKGAFVMSVRYYGYKVNLYLLHDFYVEVFYNHSRDLVDKIELLDHRSKRMNFYADQVKLSDLQNL